MERMFPNVYIGKFNKKELRNFYEVLSGNYILLGKEYFKMAL